MTTKTNELETVKVLIESLTHQMMLAIGTPEDFPSDFGEQTKWRQNLEDIAFHLEMEMALYKRIEASNDDS